MATPTVEEAATTLQGLIDSIDEAMSDRDRSALSDKLVAFANPGSSYKVPAKGPYQELRNTALDVSSDIDRKITAAAIKRIQGRSEALARYTAGISSVAAEAEKDAALLRLEVIKKVLGSTKTAIESVKSARKAFEEGRTADGFQDIEKVIGDLKQLRDGIAD